MRVPRPLYHRGWGRFLGHTFLLITHKGRKSGKRHETMAMAIAFDAATRETVVCSAWGPDTEWMRNLRACPALEIQIGGESYVPEQRFLSEDEAVLVGTEFRRRHPRRLQLLAAILGWGDLSSEAAMREFVRTRPFVSFRPLHAHRFGACEEPARRFGATADAPDETPGKDAVMNLSRSVLTDLLSAQRSVIIERAAAVLGESRARHYEAAGPQLRKSRLAVLYDEITNAVDSRELGNAITFASALAQERFTAGYDLSEVQIAVNALEEAVWRQIFTELPPDRLEDALVPVSTVFGAAKDALAREYVSLATHRHTPSLDLAKLLAGAAHG
jgi:deazaflavin-dependent oxidoreductase (nitroreductase family)